MAMAERKASVVWNGGLSDGSGTMSLQSSGAAEIPVSWEARTETPGGKTSPEELIAGALSSCYAMALSNVLGQAGNPPQELNISAVCSFDIVDGGPKVTKAEISVTGNVPGMDDAKFKELAQQAEQGCPVANSLRGNVEITLDARLSG